jgi:hypothetical protein
MRCIRRMATAMLGVLSLVACVTSEKLPMQQATATKAAQQLPQAELLDVAVELFDPNVPTLEKDQLKQHIDPNVRAAEARYMPVLLADTLQGSGFWGQVRVVPRDAAQFDVNVRGTILASTGSGLKLDIKARDATGHEWLSKTYQGEPDTRPYKDGATTKRDPFQNVYVQIADDLSALRRKLSAGDVTRIQRLSQLRFNSSIAPYAYTGYIKQDRNGMMSAVRLPAADSPLEQRLAQVRERDYALLDTLDDQYRLATEQISASYVAWRRANFTELETEEELRHSANTRMLLGIAAVVGGLAAATNSSNSSAGQILGGVAVAGGIEAFRSGLGQRTEAKAHSEALKQQLESFSAEVTPQNIEVQGRVVELRGTAEQQYLEWRRLLKELYESETGAAATAGSAAAQH